MISLLCWDLYLVCSLVSCQRDLCQNRSGFGRAQVPRSACLMLLHFPLRVVLFPSALGAVGPFRAKFCFAAVTEVLVLVGAKPL